MNNKDNRELFFDKIIAKTLAQRISNDIARTTEVKEICFDNSLIKRNLEFSLSKISLRVLMLDLHRKKQAGALHGSNPREEYNDYCKRFLGDEDYLEQLFLEFPELYRLLLLRVQQLLDLFEEILTKLADYKKQICEMFCEGRDFSGVKELDTSMGDPHRGGKRAARIVLDNDVTLYFKPHSMKKAILYQNIYAKFCVNAGLSWKHIRYLDCGDCGFEEEIRVQECSTETEVEQYYIRMGLHLFLGYLLSASDLHGENIIAHGAYPVIVDFETFPGYADQQKCKSAQEKAQRMIGDSVLRTGMLPILTWGRGEEATILSAMNTGEKRKTPFKLPVIKNAGTSEMSIAYEPLWMEMTECVVKKDGVPVDAANYIACVCNGFRSAYQYFLKQEGMLERDLRHFFDGRARIILRHTQQYAMYLFTSYYPDLCIDIKKRQDFFSFFYQNDGNETTRKIHQYEAQSLLNLDIPYFEMGGNSRSLYDGDGGEYKEYFAKTPLENWQRCLRKFGEADLERQLELIQLSVSMLKSRKIKKIVSTDNEKQMRESLIQKIVRWLCKTAVTEEDDITWLGPLFYSDEQWRISPVSMNFYDGIAGIAFFMASYLCEVRDREAEQIFNKSKNKLFAYTDGMLQEVQNGQKKPFKTGLMDGEASLVLTYIQLYRITGEEDCLTYAKKHFEIVWQSMEYDKCYDLLSGNAGALVVCASLYQLTGEETYRQKAVCIEKNLWEKAKLFERGAGWTVEGAAMPLAGMSHGNSGFITAYSMLYRITGYSEYLDKIHRMMEYEDTLYNAKIGNWLDLRQSSEGRSSTMNAWCHGAPGILLSRMFLYGQEQTEAVKRDIRRAADALFCLEPENHSCLCHGLSGNLLIMHWYLSHRTFRSMAEDSGMLEKYDASYQRMLQRFRVELNHLEQMSATERLNPSFMNGITGVGFALLELKHTGNVI